MTCPPSARYGGLKVPLLEFALHTGFPNLELPLGRSNLDRAMHSIHARSLGSHSLAEPQTLVSTLDTFIDGIT
jgi:hypothetical protein